MPTAAHEKIWLGYESILIIRANITLTWYIIQNIIWYYVEGRWVVDISRAWIEDENSKLNKDVALAVLPYVHVTLVVMNFGRIVLLIASFWRPNICRYYWYYQLVYYSVRETAPVNYGTQ